MARERVHPFPTRIPLAKERGGGWVGTVEIMYYLLFLYSIIKYNYILLISDTKLYTKQNQAIQTLVMTYKHYKQILYFHKLTSMS